MTSPISLILVLFTSFYTTTLTYATSSDSSTSEMENPSITGPPSNCVTFDSEERIITITCKTTNLTEIANQLKDPGIIARDATVDKGGY
jgi:mannuronan 5-epimerase